MLTSWSFCCGGISKKWTFVIMAFLALLLCNALRVILSITITEMTVPAEEVDIFTDQTCPSSFVKPLRNITIANTKNRFKWDEYTQGLILSSFFWGYAATQFPMGTLSERFGGKYLMGLGILIPSVLTLLTPLCLQMNNYVAFKYVILRIVMGMASGAIYPAASTMIAQWSTVNDRTLVVGIVYAGGNLGVAFGTTLPAIIMKYSPIGWSSVFYYFGAMGVFWFLAWTLLCYNCPSQHPFISEEELKKLGGNLNKKCKKNTPWCQILMSKPFWSFVLGIAGQDWVYYTLTSDLPKYMSNVVKFSLESNGYLSALPYLSMSLASLFYSWLANKVLEHQWLSKTNIRKSFGVLSLVGPAMFILSASYAECNGFLVVFLLVAGMSFMGSTYPSIYVNPLDLSPNFSGTLMAIGNGIAAVGGIFSPYVVGILTPNQTIGEWRLVFNICFTVAFFCSVYMMIYATAKTQFWNEPDFNKINNLKNSSIPTVIQELKFKTFDVERCS